MQSIKPKIGNTMVGGFLYDIGVRYYAHGAISNDNGDQLFDYYQCDKITYSQRLAILEKIPCAEFRASRKQYAPEIKSVMVCIPKAAYYRQLKNDPTTVRIENKFSIWFTQNGETRSFAYLSDAITTAKMLGFKFYTLATDEHKTRFEMRGDHE